MSGLLYTLNGPIPYPSVNLVAGAISLVNLTATSASLRCGYPSGGTYPYTYQWYRSQTNGFTPGPSNTAASTSLTLDDSGLTQGTTYYYLLVITDNAGATAQTAYFAVTTDSLATVLFSFTGPTQAYYGQASAAFVVTPTSQGYTGTVTPNDGGNGGEFVPPSLSWVNTQQPQSFIYIPSVQNVAVAVSVVGSPIINAMPQSITVQTLSFLGGASQTPVSGNSPYMTVDQLLNWADIRAVEQLAVDDGSTVIQSQLYNISRVNELLMGASGEVESALLASERYSTYDIYKPNGVSSAFIRGIIAKVFVHNLYLVRNAPNPPESVLRGYEVAQKQLEQLASGERILSFAEAAAAGTASDEFMQPSDILNLNRFTDQCSRFFGLRADMRQNSRMGLF